MEQEEETELSFWTSENNSFGKLSRVISSRPLLAWPEPVGGEIPLAKLNTLGVPFGDLPRRMQANATLRTKKTMPNTKPAPYVNPLASKLSFSGSGFEVVLFIFFFPLFDVRDGIKFAYGKLNCERYWSLTDKLGVTFYVRLFNGSIFVSFSYFLLDLYSMNIIYLHYSYVYLYSSHIIYCHSGFLLFYIYNILY